MRNLSNRFQKWGGRSENIEMWLERICLCLSLNCCWISPTPAGLLTQIVKTCQDIDPLWWLLGLVPGNEIQEPSPAGHWSQSRALPCACQMASFCSSVSHGMPNRARALFYPANRRKNAKDPVLRTVVTFQHF